MAKDFPERNRLISAWCKKLLVVEAGFNSGALITAKLAKQQNREVLAVPNSIFANESMGTNKLIEDGAHVYLNPSQLVFNKESSLQKQVKMNQEKHETLRLSVLEEKIIKIIKSNPMTIDALLKVIKEDKDSLIEKVATMELEGKIKSVAGGKITVY